MRDKRRVNRFTVISEIMNEQKGEIKASKLASVIDDPLDCFIFTVIIYRFCTVNSSVAYSVCKLTSSHALQEVTATLARDLQVVGDEKLPFIKYQYLQLI